MNPGDGIQHPSLGNGTVIAVYAKGGLAGAEVDFGYMTEWISAAELGAQFAGGGERFPPHLPIPEGGGHIELRDLSQSPNDEVDARRGILALKLGQVLEEHVLQLSTGTEKVQADLEAIVSRALQRQACSVLIEGAWGSGKTHVLTMLSAIASANGMATSSIILDGDGVTLSEPIMLMEALLGSLKYPGELAPCGLSGRLAGLRRSEARWQPRHLGGRRIADAIYDVPVSAFDEPEVVQVLEDYFTLSVATTQANRKLAMLGHPRVKLPPMKAHIVDERPTRFCELLEGWADFITLTGAKGLVLIIDELDVEYTSMAWAGTRRTSLLRALGKHLESRLPLVVAFGGTPANGDVAEEYDAILDLKKCMGGVTLEIEAPIPDLQHLRELARRVTELYARAYPERLIEVNRDKFARLLDAFAKQHLNGISPVPRNFVRGTLERLDLVPDLPHDGAEARS